MSKFRIIQTRPLTHALPYEIEECHRVWFLPWVVWRTMKERKSTGHSYRAAARRFQSPERAQAYTEQVLARRAGREATQARRLDERRQQQQLPRVVQVLGPTLPA